MDPRGWADAELELPFMRVIDVGTREVATCRSSDSVQTVAQSMRSRSISSIVVVEANRPVGIVSDRDIRSKVAAESLLAADVRVAQIMSSPLLVVSESLPVFEALLMMAEERVHRLVICASNGRLVGIVTDTDILRSALGSAEGWAWQSMHARDLEELAVLSARVGRVVGLLLADGIGIRSILDLIARMHDHLTSGCIRVVLQGELADLENGYAFAVMGSQGRREQTLATDQDSLVVWRDDLSRRDVVRVQGFAARVIDALHEVGVPPCPGGVMANQTAWQGSATTWSDRLSRWFLNIGEDSVIGIGMVADARSIHGAPGLVDGIATSLRRGMAENPLKAAQLGDNAARYSPPLKAFRRIRAHRVAGRDVVDVKAAGLVAMSEGVKALSLANAVPEVNTYARLRRLVRMGVFKDAECADYSAVLDTLLKLRLQAQSTASASQGHWSNSVEMGSLNAIERAALRSSLESVRAFQSFLRAYFARAKVPSSESLGGS